MPSEFRHFKEEIQDLLDNRLSAEIRTEVETHLQLCQECRRELEALRWTKRFSAEHFSAQEVPADLERDILNALDREDRKAGGKAVSSWIGVLKQRQILAYGFLLLLAAGLLLFYLVRPPDLPSEVARDYQNYKAERITLDLITEDVKQLEKFYSDAGIPFTTRVFDLGMMNYRLVGGRVHQFINRKSALFVYRGQGNKILICQMYPGQLSELPQGATLRDNNGIRFYVYRKNGLTLVFWQEGPTTCVLVSDIDPEEVVQLAFAKAEKI